MENEISRGSNNKQGKRNLENYFLYFFMLFEDQFIVQTLFNLIISISLSKFSTPATSLFAKYKILKYTNLVSDIHLNYRGTRCIFVR